MRNSIKQPPMRRPEAARAPAVTSASWTEGAGPGGRSPILQGAGLPWAPTSIASPPQDSGQRLSPQGTGCPGVRADAGFSWMQWALWMMRKLRRRGQPHARSHGCHVENLGTDPGASPRTHPASPTAWSPTPA